MKFAAPFGLSINPATVIAEATGGSSNDLAIPLKADGNLPQYVAISIATAAAYIRLGAAVTSTTGMIINPGDGWIVLARGDATAVHHLQVASAGVIALAAIESA